MDSPEETVARMSEAQKIDRELFYYSIATMAFGSIWLFQDRTAPQTSVLLVASSVFYTGHLIIKAVRALLEKKP